jgi:outer membrane protein OmpA-like peptidoglycan-associated protein
LYSKTIPKGRAHSRPDYTEPGGCRSGGSHEFEFESEGGTGTGICNNLSTFTIDDYGRGVSQLTTAQQAKITQIKSAIRKRARKCGGISVVEIRGHASTEGPAGRNKDLGQRRANVIKGVLSLTLRGAQVFATSKGETQPIVTPDVTDADQRKNRRVEIFVM